MVSIGRTWHVWCRISCRQDYDDLSFPFESFASCPPSFSFPIAFSLRHKSKVEQKWQDGHVPLVTVVPVDCRHGDGAGTVTSTGLQSIKLERKE